MNTGEVEQSDFKAMEGIYLDASKQIEVLLGSFLVCSLTL